MKHLFIVNPIAGGKDKSGEVRKLVEAAFQTREDSFEIYVTKAPMDSVGKIRAEAASGEALRVYACGGDGTFNECVNGAALLENVAVCPFPTGTGNDFCRMFGEEQELFRDLDALLDGTVRPIDLIDCNGRYGVNICSVGIDARVGTSAHQYGQIPFLSAASAYVVSAIVNMFHGISSPMRISCCGRILEGKQTLACACNGQYYGGGFHPSLTARPDDGVLDFFIARKVNLIQFALLIGKYAAGHAADMSSYVTHLQGTEMDIRFEREDVVNIDGEALFTDHVTMKLVPASLNLIVPKGMKFFEKP